MRRDEGRKVGAIISAVKQSISEWGQPHKQRMLSSFKTKTVVSHHRLMNSPLETRVMIQRLRSRLWILKMFVTSLEITLEQAVLVTM